MATKHKDNWLANSKATHGDGNLSKPDAISGPRGNGPIKSMHKTATATPKGKGADSKTPAVFGAKSGGGAGPKGGGKVMMAKGLMQKGK
ncbi:hypothetical protein P0D88_34810 [Paraburkholderia sp. RL18-103-BIB-C]|uniref:hypothetical protein n=1 Tax=Paraburkholderia sp. RL18-103-BIB-C TaxID=3031637 RepID=UPI0038BAD69B